MRTQTSVREAVNLALYPLDRPQTADFVALVKLARESLSRQGCLELSGFLTATGLQTVLAENVALESEAYHSRVVGNAYLTPADEEVEEDHPRRTVEPTSLGVVAYDQFPATSLTKAIYEWEPLMRFLGDVLGLEKIYRYADPLGALNLSVMHDGDYLRWHFDQTDFVTSLAVRSAERGGYFEFVPNIRGPGRQNYEEVRKVLRADHPGVVRIASAPGSLILFRGRYSIHRVSTIEGPTSRLMLLFGYDASPGTTSTEYLHKIRYGRTAPLRPGDGR